MFFFFKQKTAYEMRISDWSSDVCSSDLHHRALGVGDVAVEHLGGDGARHPRHRGAVKNSSRKASSIQGPTLTVSAWEVMPSPGTTYSSRLSLVTSAGTTGIWLRIGFSPAITRSSTSHTDCTTCVAVSGTPTPDRKRTSEL